MKNDFVWKIGGEAGYGIMSSGLIFSKACLRSGYFVVDDTEYPSLIRGGHNVYTIRVSKEKISSLAKPVDFLVALNKDGIILHQKELSREAKVILDTDKTKIEEVRDLIKNEIYQIPLVSLAKKAGGKDVMANTVALGASFYLLNGDFEILAETIKDVFSGSSPQVIDLNVGCAKAGFDFAGENFKPADFFSLKPRKKEKETIFLSGAEAIALGAAAAGCKFFAAYPMTPINSLISYFAKKGSDLGIVYKQPEDEISAINMAIGASFSGARAMTATSGGGFSLMAESYGLAGMTETPLVIVEGQRPGPATGLPTWGGQGDLRFVLHAGQDDFPRIVLAPGDPEECFWLTVKAFNLAEKYQTPAIILIDKHLAEGHSWTPVFDSSKVKIERGKLLSPQEQKQGYKRYEITASGISPRALPGREGPVFIANSDEHAEDGYSEESAENRKKMMEKRMRKLKVCEKEIPDPKIYGDKTAKITLVGWGSAKGPILEAQKILAEQKIKTRFLHLNFINPMPTNFLKKFFSNIKEKNTFIIEQNFTAQAAGLIREKIGFEIKNRILKYDGRNFFPEEITEKIKKSI